MNDLSIPGKVTETAWNLPGNLSFEELCAASKWLAKVSRGLSWWCGDLILMGQQTHGEKAHQAFTVIEDAIGPRSVHTLVKAAWVARKFPPSRRRPGLSYSHHLVVAGLSEREQTAWLDRAEKEQLTAEDLRAAVRADREEQPSEPKCKHCEIHCGAA